MTARLRWLPILLLATILTAGCASMPDAADRSQQDPAASPTPPAPSEVDARPDRPLPHPLTAADGFTPAVDAGTRTRTGEPGNAYWTQDVRYDLDATVLPQEKRVEATAVIEYTNNSPDALSRLFFELAQNLHAEGVERNTISEVTGGIQLRSVAINGTEVSEGQGMRQEGNDPHYLVRNTTLLIAPTDPLASGESVTIEIEYSFTIPQAGASGRMGYDGDDLVFIAYWYPQMTVYDDVTGWMTDPFL
ncbi:MAG TPA: M1 family peptidase, partial [Longibacter sp.]